MRVFLCVVFANFLRYHLSICEFILFNMHFFFKTKPAQKKCKRIKIKIKIKISDSDSERCLEKTVEC